MGKITLALVVFASISAYKLGSRFLKEEKFNSPFPDFFWGPKSLQSQKEDTNIYPFKINVTDKDLAALQQSLKSELKSGRLQPPLEDIAFEYGFNTNTLTTVIDYWLNKYDWRSREKLLNRHPHFKTKIAGIDIHFQHAKSTNTGRYKKTLPLLVIHGWPGSFVEHQKLIPLLTNPQESDINFEVSVANEEFLQYPPDLLKFEFKIFLNFTGNRAVVARLWFLRGSSATWHGTG